MAWHGTGGAGEGARCGWTEDKPRCACELRSFEPLTACRHEAKFPQVGQARPGFGGVSPLAGARAALLSQGCPRPSQSTGQLSRGFCGPINPAGVTLGRRRSSRRRRSRSWELDVVLSVSVCMEIDFSSSTPIQPRCRGFDPDIGKVRGRFPRMIREKETG